MGGGAPEEALAGAHRIPDEGCLSFDGAPPQSYTPSPPGESLLSKPETRRESRRCQGRKACHSRNTKKRRLQGVQWGERRQCRGLSGSDVRCRCVVVVMSLSLCGLWCRVRSTSLYCGFRRSDDGRWMQRASAENNERNAASWQGTTYEESSGTRSSEWTQGNRLFDYSK